MIHLMENLTAILEDFNRSTSNIFAVPIRLLISLFNVVIILISIASFPMRVLYAIGRHYPIFTLIMLSFLILFFFIVRRITRQSVVSYFLYTFIPYCISIVYTVCGMLFPQLHTISRVVQILLHPIRWLLGIAEQVDRRARPIREVVEVFSPGSERRRDRGSSRRKLSTSSSMLLSEKANSERIQCCICLYREKTVLLRPCNHICLCDTCFQAVMNEPPPKCPICRTQIESHMNVFL